MTAANETLGDLHEKVATVLSDALDVKNEDGIVDPRTLAVAVKFLKDNNITAKPGSDEHLRKLFDKLPSTPDESDYAYT